MPQFCCAGGCQNSSTNRKDLSFHGLPLNSKSLLSVWITKMKGDPRYFNINRHTKICSEHFTSDDFINPYSSKKPLKANAVPLIFSWNKDKQENVQPVKRSALEKLNQWRAEEEEATDTASEGEGDMAVSTRSGEELISRKTQTYEDDICSKLDEHLRIPCLHKFSASHLLSKCTTPKKEDKLFTHFTGFNSHGEFMNTATRKSIVIDTEKLFECGNDDQDGFINDEDQDKTTLTRPSAHKLLVEDEYLLVLMKLRMGLSTTGIDLAERFCVTESTVVNIFLTLINYLYETLGSLKI